MNCECFYIVNDGTIEAARAMAKDIDSKAIKNEMELFPVCISKVKKDFYATSDVDNWGNRFIVRTGSWLVFVQGKLHNMCSIRPRGGKRGFPVIDSGIYEHFDRYVEDVEELDLD